MVYCSLLSSGRLEGRLHTHGRRDLVRYVQVCRVDRNSRSKGTNEEQM